MRQLAIALSLFVCLSGSNAWADESGQGRAEQAGSALIGTKAPSLVLTTIDGQRIDLAQLYGKKAVYLKFWATWCVPCLQQMPHFEHAFETEGDDLAVIAINTNFNETLDGVKAYRQKHGLKMPIVMDDGRLAAALNLRVTPQHVLIARDGRIAFVGHLADENLDLSIASVRQPNSRASVAKVRAVAHAEALPAMVHTSAGKPFALRDPQGHKPTVLVFLSPWCEGYLKESRPEMSAQCRRVREQTDSKAKSGTVRWIGISSGLWADAADLKAYQDKNAVQIPLSLDTSGALFRGYKVTSVPTLVVLDPSGHEVKRESGADVDLDSLLTGAPKT
jgi:peroxiredoxin